MLPEMVASYLVEALAAAGAFACTDCIFPGDWRGGRTAPQRPFLCAIAPELRRIASLGVPRASRKITPETSQPTLHRGV
jgi:hypothetical protein